MVRLVITMLNNVIDFLRAMNLLRPFAISLQAQAMVILICQSHVLSLENVKMKFMRNSSLES